MKLPSAARAARALPRTVWALGFVSLLMDTSSELIHGLLPLFMSSVLGASMVTIGLVEGTAEAAVSVTKIFSGALSDRFSRRKPFVLLGYLLAALTKPVFPLAQSIGWVFAARFIDRVGKGIREAPRDALLADVTPAPLRGAAYGLRQALDSVGAFCGPLMAVVLMAILTDDIRKVMWAAVIPGLASVVLLGTCVRESEKPDAGGHDGPPSATIRQLPRSYWLVVGVAVLFTLARFSDAFLILRGADVGLAAGYAPLVMIAMNIVYAGAAYPGGVAADHVGPKTLLMLGAVFLIAADLVLAAARSPAWVFVGSGLWGLQMAATQGLFGKLVADAAPTELRGTAFGVFNLAVGMALLGASSAAGALWTRSGPSLTFLASAAFAALAVCGLWLHRGVGQRSR